MCKDIELALKLVTKEELRKEYLHRLVITLPTLITLTFFMEESELDNHLFLVCDCGDTLDLGLI